MTVATLIAVLQGCQPNATVVYPNMEIDEKIEITHVTETDRNEKHPALYPERIRYIVVLR